MSNPYTPDVYTGGQVSPADARRSAGVDAIDIELAVIEKAAKIIPAMIDGGMAPDQYLPTFQPKQGAKPQGRDVALAKAMAACVYGATLGFGVAKSLQNVFTVHNQPAIFARTAVALVLSHGHSVETVEASATSVTVRARRRGSDHWEHSTWDMERATAAGFTKNAKYTTQPEEMLWAKAAMTVCRRVFADVLEGVPYSSEELELERRPLKATATRTDDPGRGMDAVRAALAAKNTPAPEPEPAAGTSAPTSTPAPGPAAPGVTLPEILATIAGATDYDTLADIMATAADAWGDTHPDFQAAADAANARLADLTPDPTPEG